MGAFLCDRSTCGFTKMWSHYKRRCLFACNAWLKACITFNQKTYHISTSMNIDIIETERKRDDIFLDNYLSIYIISIHFFSVSGSLTSFRQVFVTWRPTRHDVFGHGLGIVRVQNSLNIPERPWTNYLFMKGILHFFGIFRISKVCFEGSVGIFLRSCGF